MQVMSTRGTFRYTGIKGGVDVISELEIAEMNQVE